MTPNLWRNCSKLPLSASAVLAALHLSEPEFGALERLDDRAWREALGYCDRSRVTLALGDAAREHLPAWVRERLDGNAAGNRQRLRGIEETYRSLARTLEEAGLEFVALKGLTVAALFGAAAGNRVQYDIDLWLPRETVHSAQAALIARGYQAMADMQDFPTDHLPALVRKTGWQWRGDFFDAEIPLSVDLHHQFWNQAVERVPAPGTEEFWARRTKRAVADIQMGVLIPADALAYASLHLLRHLLRGGARPAHVHEIARLLDSLAENEGFWEEWRAVHAPGLRLLEAVAFRLARAWFGGRSAPIVDEEIRRLPAAIEAWFQMFATSPATGAFHSNKDELWLHLSLIAERRDRWQVAVRRLAPRNLPAHNPVAYVPEAQLTFGQRTARRLRWAGYVVGRLLHHVTSLPKTALSGARWWWGGRG